MSGYRGASVNIITIDFETYYDQKYSLSKMTTEEYIRDQRFEVVGVAVKVNDERTQWVSGSNSSVGAWLQQFDWANSVCVAHNAMFDAAILSWVYDIHPKKVLCTLSMARPKFGAQVGGSLAALVKHFNLGEKGDEVVRALGKRRLDFTPEELEAYAGYCVNDVELTYKLLRKLLPGMPKTELELINLTIKMFSEPSIVLDKGLLESHLLSVREKKAKLMAAVTVDRSQLMSNPQFAELLRSRGVEPPTKISLTTGKETYAFAKTDAAFKELSEHPDPVVQCLVAARLGTKSTIEETRTERFLAAADRGKFPVPLGYYAARTGRWTGQDKLNLQNLPRKSALKRAMRAPDGHVFIDCDSSQIEARTLAWWAGQFDLVEAFARGDDVYKMTANAIFGVPVEKVDPAQRFLGKTVLLGSGYGLGPPKLYSALRVNPEVTKAGITITEDDCAHMIRVYRTRYPAVPALWRQADNALKAMLQDKETTIGAEFCVEVHGTEGVRLPNGLYLQYPNLRWETNDGKEEMVYDLRKGKAVIPTRIYGPKLVENICQALARIIIGEQMVAVSKRYRPVLTVHDAIGCIAPEKEADEALAFVQECMRIPPDWAVGLPLACEGSYGPSYGDCK